MTDRIRHLTVVLDADYRDDDVASIVEAIRMIRGVAHIEEHIVEAQDQLARMAVRSEIESALHKAIDSVFTRKSVERMVAEQKGRT
jgi:geranylgeranyl pyrophosphate synthase